ncbi:DUF4252 domain-containing protein [Chitinophaga nivalis]|uniref:DUF4252 domain-containing protein n=1 Tax=Chitinophaga nivalis TaxID=2991709 RepID=A0ABT3IL62_9BACT|nr:DUF4252 domain-containing protein [Chitinophaga nivalis]MCW3465614.1 DUF4252 domain-containing protein [Chitinophaga nivalis]MCW3484695.1 DUF4252 domain-containing protein [Chitinophaga nivalis]
MKRFLLLFIAVFFSMHLFAQQGSVIDRFFQKYESDRTFSLVSITPKMFSMFAKIDMNDPDAKSMLRIIQKLRGLRILAKEDTKDGPRLYREAAAFLSSDFEELMTVRDKDSDLKFLVKENSKGSINELIMLVGSSKEFLAMSLVGEIDLNEISQIASSVNIQGMDKLKNVKKK